MTVWTYFTHIASEECEDLLARTTIGRLAVIIEGRPEIFPMNHVFDPEHRCVVVATNPSTKLRAALDWPWVAYEVDGVDPDEDAAWSVMVVGRAEEITDRDEIASLRPLRQVAWVPGDELRWVRILPSKVTGRRVQSSVAGDDQDLRREQ